MAGFINAIKKDKAVNILYKPDGRKIEVNDNSLEYALSLGWQKTNPVKKAAPKKTTRSRKKAE